MIERKPIIGIAGGIGSGKSFVARLFEGTWYGGADPGLDDARTAVRHLSDIGCDAQADPAI